MRAPSRSISVVARPPPGSGRSTGRPVEVRPGLELGQPVRERQATGRAGRGRVRPGAPPATDSRATRRTSSPTAERASRASSRPIRKAIGRDADARSSVARWIVVERSAHRRRSPTRKRTAIIRRPRANESISESYGTPQRPARTPPPRRQDSDADDADRADGDELHGAPRSAPHPGAGEISSKLCGPTPPRVIFSDLKPDGA